MPLALQVLRISLLIFLVDCAGVRSTSQSFINETSMGDSVFQATAQADWTQAQHSLATQPINLAAGSFGVKDVPPDPRALSIQPPGIVVKAIPDALGHPGIIPCGSVTGFCYAYLDNEHTIIVPPVDLVENQLKPTCTYVDAALLCFADQVAQKAPHN